jgi:hypothetical protein
MTAKRVYFFSGAQYVRFDSGINNVLPNYPLDIARWWGGLPAGISAAFYRGRGRAYFFAGNQYYRYTVVRNAVDPNYPKPIAGNWPGMSDIGFDSDIGAAVNWGNGKVYFFKGDQYARYDLPSDKVDPGYPKPITGNWPGVAGTGFEAGLDAAITYGNGKVYFFRGDKYLRLDLVSKAVDAGYPKAIAGNWPGVYASGIDAALEWPYAELAPGGFRVPTGNSGCTVVATTAGRRKAGEQFRMELDYQEPAHPVTCAVGEYRQFVRGTFVANGVALTHGLPNPTGGGPVTMLPTPAPGAASDNFLEDGLVTPPAGANVFYGHRIDTAGNSDTTDQFLPDRLEGCQYRGNDFPGIESAIGTTYNIALDFRGSAVDTATSGEVLQTNDWSVNCSGTL